MQRHKYTKETLLTIEEDNVLDLVLSEHIDKIASTLEIERNKITYYPDLTRHLLIDRYFLM